MATKLFANQTHLRLFCLIVLIISPLATYSIDLDLDGDDVGEDEDSPLQIGKDSLEPEEEIYLEPPTRYYLNPLIRNIHSSGSRIPFEHQDEFLNKTKSNGRLEDLNIRMREKCGHPNEQTGYISGGRDSRIGEFPAYVKILQKNGKTSVSHCGGTIISRSHILTAGHCFGNERKDIYVQATISNPDSLPDLSEMSGVDKVCRSAGYNSRTAGHDIAVLRLTKPLDYGPNVYSACLPSHPLEPATETAHIVGLGYFDKREIFSKHLQALPVKQVHCNQGAEEYHICFQAQNPRYLGDACLGDSGGPVFATQDNRLTVVGVVSHGKTDCEKGINNPSVNMNTYQMREEILKLVEKCS